MQTPTLTTTTARRFDPRASRMGLLAATLAAVVLATGALSGCGAPAAGSGSELGIVHQGLSQAGPVEVGFNAPEGLTDPLGDDLADYIDGAAVSLDAALYKLTHRGAVDALLQAHARGIVVRMVSDTKHRDRKDAGPIYTELEAAGIPIVYDERKSDIDPVTVAQQVEHRAGVVGGRAATRVRTETESSLRHPLVLLETFTQRCVVLLHEEW